jgi:hypothetical protein
MPIPALVALAIPMIPGLVREIMGVVAAWKQNPQTPEEAQALLDQAEWTMKAAVQRAQNAPTPD